MRAYRRRQLRLAVCAFVLAFGWLLVLAMCGGCLTWTGDMVLYKVAPPPPASRPVEVPEKQAAAEQGDLLQEVIDELVESDRKEDPVGHRPAAGQP